MSDHDLPRTESSPASDLPSATAVGASSVLLAAALAGLMATAPACSSTEKVDPTPRADAGAEESFSRLLQVDSGLSFEEFRQLCEERQGWAYLTSSCAGSGMCRGLFLLDGTLSEQSCKGMNGCGGAGCVTMPKDSGKSAQEILDEGGCANCHAHWNDDYTEFDYSTFTLPYGAGQTAEGKLAQFDAASDDRLVSIMVFGTQGIETGGIYFSNMPAYRDKLSLAEIRRTVKQIRSMPKLPKAYEYFGRESQSAPEAGAADAGAADADVGAQAPDAAAHDGG